MRFIAVVLFFGICAPLLAIEDLTVPDEIADKRLQDIIDLYYPNEKPGDFKRLPAITEMDVPLNELANSTKTTDQLAPLFKLKARDKLIYPFMIKEGVVASVNLSMHKEKWTVTAISKHRGNSLTDLVFTIQDLGKTNKNDESDYYLIKIDGLNIKMIGRKGSTTLIMTQDRPEFSYTKGEALDVKKLIPILREPAMEYLKKH